MASPECPGTSATGLGNASTRTTKCPLYPAHGGGDSLRPPTTCRRSQGQQVAHLDPNQATLLLWNTYQPWRVWWVFGAIGFAAGIATFFYARWARKFEAADI